MERERNKIVSSSVMNKNPLVVADGIPMDLSVLNTIPVEDVSELRVLKDAGEYGVRGANGAIVIKTGK